jgi:peptidoglycan/xylan/chitin deacetylase (PgdA/CDA1 family)
MGATFILSLDCEGKWGVADHLTAEDHRDLNDSRLQHAYRSILGILDEHRVPATFAFVGAFGQSRAGFARIRPQIEALAVQAPAYLGPALRNIDEFGGSGWHGDHLVEAVGSAVVSHEIALHGVTHVPWPDVTSGFAETEMRLAREFEGALRDTRTFVYPRDRVAHVDVLAAHGFEGFRTARPKRSRAASLLSEFDLSAVPEQAGVSSGIVPIPAGFFLNWRSGLRKLVPPAVTIARARRLLDVAARSAGIVHYWLHPENVASAPATLGLLRSLVHEVAKRRDSGHCQILTQLAYCRSLESQR